MASMGLRRGWRWDCSYDGEVVGSGRPRRRSAGEEVGQGLVVAQDHVEGRRLSRTGQRPDPWRERLPTQALLGGACAGRR